MTCSHYYLPQPNTTDTCSIHPDVAGHPHVLKMLDRVIAHINKHEGVEWVKMEDICDDFKKKNQPVKGALLPAERGLVLKDAGESILSCST